jgi:hypothetical protein
MHNKKMVVSSTNDAWKTGYSKAKETKVNSKWVK